MGDGRRVGGLNPRGALNRLREPSDPALRILASLIITDVEQTTLRDLVHVDRVSHHFTEALIVLVRSPRAEPWLRAQIVEWRTRHLEDSRSLRTWVPEDLLRASRAILSEPWSPDEALVLRLLDQPAVRQLVHDTLEDALTRFQKRLRSLDSTGLGALGARAARRGKGLFGGLGGLTENLVGAVAEELENAIQQRISDYVDSATGEAIRGAARHLADPQHAGAFGAMRASALDVLLAIPFSQWMQESERVDIDKAAAMIRDALHDALGRDAIRAPLQDALTALLDRHGDRTLRAGLDETDLSEVWRAAAMEFIEPRLRKFVDGAAFESWWMGLLSSST